MRAELSSHLQHFRHVLATHLPIPLCPPLWAAQTELRRSLHLAFRLAALHRRAVVLEPFLEAAEGCLALHLPKGVRWGRPLSIPLPPSLEDSGWQDGRPRPITVMPQRRASANVWFLHHGRQALCLRLDLSGAVELLRYRPLLRAWVNC
jgi:hypothetical protein